MMRLVLCCNRRYAALSKEEQPASERKEQNASMAHS